MKKFTLAFGALLVVSTLGFAGPEPYSGKEMKQVVPPPCPQWYADNEWNISLWGAVAFGGGNDNDIHESDLTFEDGETVHFNDTIGDVAGGGGIDIKYFFHRYFGIGIEGYGLATDNNRDVSQNLRDVGIDPSNDDAVGAVKGTVTLRYPIPCSRWSPYIFAGGGVIFGGGREKFVLIGVKERFVRQSEDDARALGQVGGGIEYRFTPHIGWMLDGSWNFTEDDDFGMVRSGVNFAF